MAAKIFRSIIDTGGFQLEILPRVKSLHEAVERCIDNKAIANDYRWEVHELTLYGDSKKIVSGKRHTQLKDIAYER